MGVITAPWDAKKGLKAEVRWGVVGEDSWHGEHFSGWFEGEKGKLFIKHEGLWGTGEETTKLCYLEKLRKKRGKGR